MAAGRRRVRHVISSRAPFRGHCRALVLLALGLLVACGHERDAEALAPATPPAKADRVLVVKGERKLYLMQGDMVLDSFAIALGRNPQGPKTAMGDMRTPEGRYVLDWRNPKSQFYRSIHISYPNKDDVARARRTHVSPGGAIMIHGQPNGLTDFAASFLKGDWTDGCIAVTNHEMDIIWRLIEDNTPIEIRP